MKMTFGEQLRDRREKRRCSDPDFSLRKFARKVGVSASFLSKVERGKADPPRADKIIRMANLLNINSDELLAQAGRIDPAIRDLILERPAVMADLLRAARNRPDEYIRDLLKGNKDGNKTQYNKQ